MNLLIGGRTASAPVAQERLQILLAHERGLRRQPDLLDVLQAEILAVVSRHIACLIRKRSPSGWTGASMSRRLKSILRCLTVSRGQLRSLPRDRRQLSLSKRLASKEP
jgi:cell division topological specificity factor MinE